MLPARKARCGFVLGALAVCSASAFGGDEISVEARRTMLDLRITETVLTECGCRDVFPGPNEEFVPLDRLVGDMDPLYRDRLVLRDAWDNRVMYVGNSDGFILLSVGPDGRLDQTAKEMRRTAFAHGMPSLAEGDDTILSGGEFIKRPLTEAQRTIQRQRVTMADLRSIGTSIEEYAIDHNVYPPATGGLVPLDSLRSLLEPVYIRRLPTLDAWGQPFMVWSTGDAYMIVSTGADGLPDGLYDREPLPELQFRGSFQDPATDVIFADGQFVQWPEGTQQ